MMTKIKKIIQQGNVEIEKIPKEKLGRIMQRKR